ncbi:hypothetical protein NQ314_019483 [Rhamnusium bicolor]|uniref:CCHC-type domain-containing protein n=1 Tax=Rhamnusium bicolor TaxID=1586634 RepID=A0AAV8WPD1_9CUCU|nr:hypothetical protein NQ314_019483 [Rhamnusium bicolor]
MFLEYIRTKELKLCLNCLKGGHFVSKCRQKSLYKKCSGKHNTLHHEATKLDENLKGLGSSHVVLSLVSPSNFLTLLSTVSLQVFDTFGKPHIKKSSSKFRLTVIVYNFGVKFVAIAKNPF